MPLVIQAGTGWSKYQYRQFIIHGVAKFNYGSDLRNAAGSQVPSNAEQHRAKRINLMNRMREVISTEVETCIRLGGSSNRAKELLTHCAPWAPVEHLIIYNVNNISEHNVDVMLSEGRQSLRTIPGVREVITARAIKMEAEYRYA